MKKKKTKMPIYGNKGTDMIRWDQSAAFGKVLTRASLEKKNRKRKREKEIKWINGRKGGEETMLHHDIDI